MQELLKSLIAAKKEFKPIAKDKQSNRNKYASLDSILSSVEPALLDNNLVVTQQVERQQDMIVLVTKLYHVSGEVMATTYPLPLDGDFQKQGSALTYLRRYALCALLSVTAEEDDDANSAVSSPQMQIVESPSKKALKASLTSLKVDVEKNGKAISQELFTLGYKGEKGKGDADKIPLSDVQEVANKIASKILSVSA